MATPLFILNITPNSFSDGGAHLGPSSLYTEIKNLRRYSNGPICLDIGAESTAPMNDTISGDEEIRRFQEYFFPVLKGSTLLAGDTVSVDTYRPETFLKVYNELQSYNQDINIIWNDISGAVDSETVQALVEAPKADYVFCHNRSQAKSTGAGHMDYAPKVPEQKDDLFKEVSSFFQGGVDRLEQKGIVSQRVILDPCLGFAKHLEENILLLKYFEDLRKGRFLAFRFLLGASRKSFLRYQAQSSGEEFSKKDLTGIEIIHTLWLQRLLPVLSEGDLIRLHDPRVFFHLKAFDRFIEEVD